jgi:hypothetical protein
MTNKRDLKAFVRYDGSGRVVAGSLILRRKKPKVGKWNEVQGYECCNDVTITFTVGSATITNVALSLFCNGTLIGSKLQTHVNTTTTAGIKTALNNAFSVIGTFDNVGSDFSLVMTGDQKTALCPVGTLTMTIAAT